MSAGSSTHRPLRVLVVDDSAYNRRNIGDILASSGEIEVVGKAADGEEALRLATNLRPDVVTLDLEMPRMDGFTFLRILMARQPTPVIVISSYSQKENVFKALELGAIDFVAKPDRQVGPDSPELRDQILAKVLMVQNLRPAALPANRPSRGSNPPARTGPGMDAVAPPQPPLMKFVPPRHLVAIASSTGGPTALLEIFGRLPAKSNLAIVVAQHMPDKFTRTFAERLARKGPMPVSEAADADPVFARTAFVCPGRQCMELEQVPETGHLRLRVGSPVPGDRYVPSADRLFKSAAKAMGSRTVGIVLTGMGDDGAEGARAIRQVGGTVIAESPDTAVVYGMPGAAVRTGAVNSSMTLSQIGDYLAQLG